MEIIVKRLHIMWRLLTFYLFYNELIKFYFSALGCLLLARISIVKGCRRRRKQNVARDFLLLCDGSIRYVI